MSTAKGITAPASLLSLTVLLASSALALPQLPSVPISSTASTTPPIVSPAVSASPAPASPSTVSLQRPFPSSSASGYPSSQPSGAAASSFTLPLAYFTCPPNQSLSFCLDSAQTGSSPLLINCLLGVPQPPIDCRATSLGPDARCYYASGVPTAGDAMCHHAPPSAPPLQLPTSYNGSLLVYGVNGILVGTAPPPAISAGQDIITDPAIGLAMGNGSVGTMAPGAASMGSGGAGGSAPTTTNYYAWAPGPTATGGVGNATTATTLGSTWSPLPTQSGVATSAAAASSGVSKGAAAGRASAGGLMGVLACVLVGLLLV